MISKMIFLLGSVLCATVHVPTFGNSTLDKFFCDDYVQERFCVKICPPLGIAINAHNIVTVYQDGQDDCSSVHLHKVFDLRESYVQLFREVLSKTDWSSVTSSENVDKCVDAFYDAFYRAMSHIPVSFIKFSTKTKPWITPVLI